MNISLQQVGKKFNRQWLFRDITFDFSEHHSYAIVGNNGSGKSTLLQMIYGFQTISRGSISHTWQQQQLSADKIHEHSSFVAPYLELPEELTAEEMFRFHFQFKPKVSHLSIAEMILLCKLEASKEKQIRFFSSGMKQRLKLALAFFSETPLLLLDEPCSNLDAQGMAWYQQMIKEVLGKRTILIASNQVFEYDFCDGELNVVDYAGVQ